MVPFLVTLAAVVYLFSPPAPEAQSVAEVAETVTDTRLPVEVGHLAPISESALEMPAPQLSAREMETLLLRKLQRQEQMDAHVDSSPPSPPGLSLVPGRETQVTDPNAGEFHGTPALLVIGRNNKNTNANNAALASTLAEPAAANNAMRVFAAGNFNHAEISTNGGSTWANVALPGGPADASILCCDHDVVIDDARRVFFHSVLYTNGAQTNGVVRIFVRRTPPAASCAYDIDPAGTANNILPDYPHLGLTKRFLYLTINALSTSSFARIYRFNIDQMADCVGAAFTTFTQPSTTFGQRVWVPAEGTNNIETMYWGQLDNTSTFRIFSWPETAAAPTSVTRAISTSTFSNPDCRGGVGNFDFIERSTAWTITGFRLRGVAAPGALGGPGALAFYWNVGRDAQHTQGHVHAAAFSLAGLALVAQPHIFNNTFCFGYPAVTANKRGDIGITIAAGGRAGGGGTAAQGFVGIDDEFTSGVGFFGTFSLTASGTHNRSDSRYGDYFTIHPYEPCEKWFTATNYALINGTGVANVNSRYIEFGRNQSKRCYDAHRSQLPVSPQ
jgi:hypothetical protein